MKRYIVVLLLLSIFNGLSQEKNNYNIGVLIDSRTTEVEPLLQKLQSEIKVVVGEDAVISFPDKSILVNNFDLEKAQDNYEQLITNDTDIILAFGIINNQIISKQQTHKKPTILFGAVNRDLIKEIDLSKKASGIKNFTYLIESQSYQDDFKLFKELTGFKKLGIAIEAPFTDILPLKSTFDKEMAELEADYKLIPFNTVSDIIGNLDDIDAIYMAGGFFLSKKDNQQLAKTFVQKRLPSFTANGTDDVEIGMLATNQSEENIEQFFRRIALTIEAYINGDSLSEMPVSIDYTPRLTINFNTAEAIGVPIKYSLIAKTDFVGEFKNVLSQKQYNLLTAINDGLENNLQIQTSQKNVELSQQDVKSAKSNYLPSLTASGTATYVDPDAAAVSNGQNPEFSTSGNVTVQQTIFSEAANANITIQNKLQKAQEASFNADQLDLIFTISNLYFNALILKTNVQIQAQNLDLTKKNLLIAEQNFEAGASGKSDVLRFRSQLAQNTQSLVESINQLEQGFIQLNQALNNPVNFEIDIEEALLNQGIFKSYNYDEFADLLDDPSLREPFIDFLIEEAKNNAPELESLQYNLEATTRSIKLNGPGRFLPTVALQGQYNRTFNRTGEGSTAPVGFELVDDNYNVSLNVSIPIFNQNLNNINRDTAIIQKEQLELNKENTELGIATNIRSQVLNMINQISNIQLSIVSEETAEESLELTQTSYSSGSVNIVQLLDAQSNLLNARLASANANYNYLINSLQLERFLGYYFLLNDEQDNIAFRQRFFDFLNGRN
ncbi:TolC family protein [Aquimarina sp. D1M17]|uniref:TolC family protein n=1 Tax=Aquimarina acroporae TaxID=2937283 RepID=UPI0020BF6B3F|nr:TolC family protein [Aquimarina acroporae]MCK8520792.1 TolC family protein [Aquimarina acroporae]